MARPGRAVVATGVTGAIETPSHRYGPVLLIRARYRFDGGGAMVRDANRRVAAAAPPRGAPAEARQRAGAEPVDAREPISRGDGARQRVLRAALEVLDEDGLVGFTMEAVARRAGASKATLYRRWPTVGALLIDAMDATFKPLPVPDTGDVRTDLVHLLTAFVTLLAQTR